jgi:hypothetical protein
MKRISNSVCGRCWLGVVLLPWLVAGCAGTATRLSPPVFGDDAVVFLGAAAIPGGSWAMPGKSGLPHKPLGDGKS